MSRNRPSKKRPVIDEKTTKIAIESEEAGKWDENGGQREGSNRKKKNIPDKNR